jgi:hypothetical protein
MSGTLLAILATTAAVVYYVSSCIFWPYTSCGRCKGNGKHGAWWGGGFRLCGRCSGSGRRLRTGRRIYNFIRSKQKDASR